jgi:hypothetical protein
MESRAEDKRRACGLGEISNASAKRTEIAELPLAHVSVSPGTGSLFLTMSARVKAGTSTFDVTSDNRRPSSRPSLLECRIHRSVVGNEVDESSKDSFNSRSAYQSCK